MHAYGSLSNRSKLQGILLKNYSEEKTFDFSRLGMIVDIYGHELQPLYEKIMKAREELNKISIAHKRAYKAGDFDGESYLEPYSKAQIKLEELTESFKKEIADHAKNA